LASKIIRLEKKKNANTIELIDQINPDDHIENAFLDNCVNPDPDDHIENAFLDNCVNPDPDNFIENSIQNAYCESCVKNPYQSNFKEIQLIKFYFKVINASQKFLKHCIINNLFNLLSFLNVSFVFLMMLKIIDFFFIFYFKDYN
jgi:hypothetical protein